jgi:hypothetical protein
LDRFVARVLFLCAVTTSSPLFAGEAERLFDGKTLTGWEGDTKYTWRVEKRAIVGGSLNKIVPRNEFLCTTRHYSDFELKVTFKLLGDREQRNAGVQFRTNASPIITKYPAIRQISGSITGGRSTTSRGATVSLLVRIQRTLRAW